VNFRIWFIIIIIIIIIITVIIIPGCISTTIYTLSLYITYENGSMEILSVKTAATSGSGKSPCIICDGHYNIAVYFLSVVMFPTAELTRHARTLTHTDTAKCISHSCPM
jgi:uncharacterized membrane protein